MIEAFEARYRADPDPWRTLTDPYERAKLHRTLAACGSGPFTAALDLGAGLGALAEHLAPRCRTLLALDAAPTAVAAARRRLAAFPQARVQIAELPRDLPPGPFDLVVASEILYYLDGAALAELIAWLGGAVAPGGRAVAVHWTGAARDLRRDAHAVGAALAATPGLRPVTGSDGRETGFRLDVLEHRACRPPYHRPPLSKDLLRVERGDPLP